MDDRFLPIGESNEGKFTITVRYGSAPDGWVEDLYRAMQQVIRERQNDARMVRVQVEINGGFGAYDGQ